MDRKWTKTSQRKEQKYTENLKWTKVAENRQVDKNGHKRVETKCRQNKDKRKTKYRQNINKTSKSGLTKLGKKVDIK